MNRKIRYLDDGRKVCSLCDEAKSPAEFYKRGKAANGTDRLSSYCRDCNKQYDKVHAANKKRIKATGVRAVTIELHGALMRIQWSDGTITREKAHARRFYGMKLAGARLINKPQRAGGAA